LVTRSYFFHPAFILPNIPQGFGWSVCRGVAPPIQLEKTRRLAIVNKRKVVLVVDDDPAMLKGVQRLLQVHGFDAVLFDTADAFQDYTGFDQACCVVLDINLNGQSGIGLRRRLTTSGILIPVIFITGNDSDATRAAALDAGCIAYLTKPFLAKSLIDPIEQATIDVGRPA
jgi:FixJ family two-component response regulator